MAEKRKTLERKDSAQKTRTAHKLFEFYKVLDNSITETKSQSITTEPCDPRHQRTTARTLPKCAETYGVGNFVALEVGANSEGLPQGLPLSYWVIKVRPMKRRAFREVCLTDNELRACRQVQFPVPASADDLERERASALLAGETIPEGGQLFKFESREFWAAGFDDNYRWQRHTEAAFVAERFLKSLPDPKVKELTPHQYVRKRKQEGARKKDIVTELMVPPFCFDYEKAESQYRNSFRVVQKKKKNRRDNQTSAVKKTITTSKKQTPGASGKR